MWYVYLLKSKKYKWFYVGITNDLQNRFKMHNLGKVESTEKLKPFVLIYYEALINKYDAAKREKFLKTGWGKNWIKKTLGNYFKELKS
ncbi:MAG: GIY-YIG nuclease family protein [Candidatus Staskawiczbacteria bacterium]|nr:GIY-YIG nuclease family protein [Candidatus Staskawiczbacteria bacterium]